MEIPDNIYQKCLQRKKLYDSGVRIKSAHRCFNCGKEFDCGAWECDFEKDGTIDVYCSVECSREYND